MTQMHGKMKRLPTVIYPSLEVNGQWVAHCLPIDLVSQGNDPAHAIEMIAEAIEMVAEHHVSEGREPFAGMETAPLECWEMLALAEPLVDRIVRLPKLPPIVPSVVDRAA